MNTQVEMMSTLSLFQLTHLRQPASQIFDRFGHCACPVVLEEPMPITQAALKAAGVAYSEVEEETYERFSFAMEGVVGSVNYRIYHLTDGERSIYTLEGESGDTIHLIVSLLNRLSDEEATKWIKEYIL